MAKQQTAKGHWKSYIYWKNSINFIFLKSHFEQVKKYTVLTERQAISSFFVTLK